MRRRAARRRGARSSRSRPIVGGAGAQGPDRAVPALGRARARRRRRSPSYYGDLLDGLVADERADGRAARAADRHAAWPTPRRARRVAARGAALRRGAGRDAAGCGRSPILPVKRFGAAKQRLDDGLSDGTRRALAEAMVADVLDALRRAERSTRCSSSPASTPAARWPRGYDAAAVVDDPTRRGHSAAAARGVEARARARRRRASCSSPATARRWTRPRSTRCSSAEPRPRASSIVPDRHGDRHQRAAARRRPTRSRPRSARAAASATSGCARRGGRRVAVVERPVARRSTSTPPTTSRRCAPRSAHAAAAPRTRAACSRRPRRGDDRGRARSRGCRRSGRATTWRRCSRPRGATLARRRRARASPTRSSPRPRAASSRSPTSSPAPRALELAAEHGKDPRHVEVVLRRDGRGRARRRAAC